MASFPHGLYESLVTEALATRLEALPRNRQASTDALRTAEAADRIAWHIASVVERAIEMLPESQRTEAGMALARSLVDRVVEGSNVAELSDQRPSDPAEVLRGVHRLRPDGTPAQIEAPAHPAPGLRAPHQRPRRARRGPPGRRGDRVGRPHRPDHGVHPPLRDPAAAGEAAEARGRRRHAPGPDYYVHRLHRARRAGLAPGARRRRPGLLRHHQHAPPRQGLALPPRLRLLHRLRRLVQPHPLGAGDGPRVERPDLRRPQPLHRREGGRGLRELLGGGRLRAVRRRALRRRRRPRPARRRPRDPPAHRDPTVPVPGAAAGADRAVPGARAPPEPAGGRHRDGEDRHGRAGLPAAAEGAAGQGRAGAAPLRRPPGGDPDPEPGHVRPRAPGREFRRGVGRGPEAGGVRPRLRVHPVARTRAAWTPLRPTTSTW